MTNVYPFNINSNSISFVSVWAISERSDDEKQKQACDFIAEHLRTTASQKSISKAKYT